MITGAKRMATKQKRSTRKKSVLSTFTYYIPAPPHRKSGYREKEFDKILTGILASGFKIVSLHTQAVNSGLYVMAVLEAQDIKVSKLDEFQDIHERFRFSETHSSPDIILEDEEFSDDF